MLTWEIFIIMIHRFVYLFILQCKGISSRVLHVPSDLSILSYTHSPSGSFISAGYKCTNLTLYKSFHVAPWSVKKKKDFRDTYQDENNCLRGERQVTFFFFLPLLPLWWWLSFSFMTKKLTVQEKRGTHNKLWCSGADKANNSLCLAALALNKFLWNMKVCSSLFVCLSICLLSVPQTAPLVTRSFS